MSSCDSLIVELPPWSDSGSWSSCAPPNSRSSDAVQTAIPTAARQFFDQYPTCLERWSLPKGRTPSCNSCPCLGDVWFPSTNDNTTNDSSVMLSLPNTDGTEYRPVDRRKDRAFCERWDKYYFFLYGDSTTQQVTRAIDATIRGICDSHPVDFHGFIGKKNKGKGCFYGVGGGNNGGGYTPECRKEDVALSLEDQLRIARDRKKVFVTILSTGAAHNLKHFKTVSHYHQQVEKVHSLTGKGCSSGSECFGAQLVSALATLDDLASRGEVLDMVASREVQSAGDAWALDYEASLTSLLAGDNASQPYPAIVLLMDEPPGHAGESSLRIMSLAMLCYLPLIV